MAYSTANPPILVSSGLNNTTAPAEWRHQSADAGATVDTDGFVTNGFDLGMKVGDLFVHRDTGTDIVTTHVVKTLNANGSVDLTDTTTTASGTDTD